MNPKVSVITVCLNSEKTIERTIKSVANQKYSNIEYIVIDGGSTDNTLIIIEKYKEIISNVISEKDEGIYDAMNKGIQQSTGEILFFLNSGDFFFNCNVVQAVIKKFNTLNNIDILYGNFVCYNDQGMNVFMDQNFYDLGEIFANGICHQTIFVKKSVFKDGFAFNTKYRVFADYDWLLKVLTVGHKTIAHIPIPIALYLNGGFSDIEGSKYQHERREINLKYQSLIEKNWVVIKYPKILERFNTHPLIKGIWKVKRQVLRKLYYILY